MQDILEVKSQYKPLPDSDNHLSGGIAEWIYKCVASKEQGWYRFFDEDLRCGLSDGKMPDEEGHDIQVQLGLDYFVLHSIVPQLQPDWGCALSNEDTKMDITSRAESTLYVDTKKTEIVRVEVEDGRMEDHICNVKLQIYFLVKSDMGLVVSGMKYTPKVVIDIID